MIGLVLPLLLPTPTIWFSLDHKWNVNDRVSGRIATLFSLDRKLYTSNSDSVASENEPLELKIKYLILYYKAKPPLSSLIFHLFGKG